MSSATHIGRSTQKNKSTTMTTLGITGLAITKCTFLIPQQFLLRLCKVVLFFVISKEIFGAQFLLKNICLALILHRKAMIRNNKNNKNCLLTKLVADLNPLQTDFVKTLVHCLRPNVHFTSKQIDILYVYCFFNISKAVIRSYSYQ